MIPMSRNVQGYTGSEQSFRIIKDWIETCLATHTGLCSKHSAKNGASELPDRILELSLGMLPRVRLVDTGNRLERYACLSHCWGGRQPLQTTRDTISAHRQNINLGSLPKTFRDAIKVALAIGIQYIWIDSLCVREVHQKPHARMYADVLNRSSKTTRKTGKLSPS